MGLLVAGCGGDASVGGGAGGSLPEVLYAVNGGSSNIAAFRILRNGALAPLAGSPFPAPRSPGPLIVNSSRTAVFSVGLAANPPELTAYTVDAKGALKSTSALPFSAGIVDPSPDASAAFIYTFSRAGNVSSGSAYSLNADATVSPVPGSTLVFKGIVEGLRYDPGMPFAYASVYDGSNGHTVITGFSVEPSGALTPISGSSFTISTTPRANTLIDFNPVAKAPTFGQFAYVTVSAHGATLLTVFRVGPDGLLSLVAGPISPGESGFFSPSGTLMAFPTYAPDTNTGAIQSNVLNADGTLTPVSSQSLAGLAVAAAFSPSGSLLYVTGTQSAAPVRPTQKGGAIAAAYFDAQEETAATPAGRAGFVAGFSVSPDGVLTPVPGSPVATDPSPVAIVVDRSGRFAYVANSRSNEITGYAIGADGSLSQVPGSPFPSGAGPIFLTLLH